MFGPEHPPLPVRPFPLRGGEQQRGLPRGRPAVRPDPGHDPARRRPVGPRSGLVHRAGVRMSDDDRWLGEAIALAASNVGEGGGPFGAVLVRGDELVSSGVNRVTVDLDPTAHAEVTAIRTACRNRGDFNLPGAVLYTSCEP